MVITFYFSFSIARWTAATAAVHFSEKVGVDGS